LGLGLPTCSPEYRFTARQARSPALAGCCACSQSARRSIRLERFYVSVPRVREVVCRLMWFEGAKQRADSCPNSGINKPRLFEHRPEPFIVDCRADRRRKWSSSNAADEGVRLSESGFSGAPSWWRSRSVDEDETSWVKSPRLSPQVAWAPPHPVGSARRHEATFLSRRPSRSGVRHRHRPPRLISRHARPPANHAIPRA
jgi:hypothetical protein